MLSLLSTSQAGLESAKHIVKRQPQNLAGLYFGNTVSPEPVEGKKKAFSFSGWKGQMRQEHPWIRSVLDTFNWNHCSSFADKNLGGNFALGRDGYPQSLAMTDFYLERALEKENYEVQDIAAKDFGVLILKNFAEEKGAADIAFKYLDKGTQLAGRVVNLTIHFLLDYGHLTLEDGSTLKDKAKDLILDHGNGIKPNELESFELLEKYFPEEANLRQSLLEKKAETSKEPWVFKRLGDAYYRGVDEVVKSSSEKALKYYELYLKHLEEFDKKETPLILHRLAALFDNPFEIKIGLYHRIAEPFLKKS